MKSISIIKKNFKLLLRAKSSAFIILIGPLLIIMLVGLVFSGKASYELSMGYVAPEKNNLTASFVDTLQKSNYYVHEYPSEPDCIEKIEQGIIHTCIIFPQGFKVANQPGQDLRFLVDYSRINLVYQVIGSVSEILDVESKELSYSLTRVLLDKLNLTLKEVNQDKTLAEGLSQKANSVLLDLQKARNNTAALDLELKNISTAELNQSVNEINSTFVNITALGLELINQSQDLIDELSGHIGENQTQDLQDEFDSLAEDITDIYNKTPGRIGRLDKRIRGISLSLSEIESSMKRNQGLSNDTKAKLDSSKANLTAIQKGLTDLKNSLSKAKQELEGISVTSAQTIVSPVNVKIEPVAAESSKMLFAFPFLLVLVIMFVALLLSSTLVLFEKGSKACFRVNITPTRPGLFVFTTFITSLIILLLQTIIILGLSNYFLHITVFKNPLPSLLIILATAMFFITLGMLIGYLLSTQEGAVMSSIILGCVLMFLSNLVFPLESIAPALSGIIRYNPYVLSSELLRKSLLFNTRLSGEPLLTILILVGAALIIFLCLLIAISWKDRKKIKPLSELGADKKGREIQGKQARAGFEGPGRGIDSGEHDAPEFVVYGKKASDKEELFKLVSDMTKTDFEENVNEHENRIADWVEKGLKDKKLASKLKKTVSRKEILSILGSDLKKAEEKEGVEEEPEAGYSTGAGAGDVIKEGDN